MLELDLNAPSFTLTDVEWTSEDRKGISDKTTGTSR